ncbi:MAG: VCBS repeat-containing protein [Planctomycetes bacterium]|nr:VCBS repeat-containing protein [Planctomycetota bacterium]
MTVRTSLRWAMAGLAAAVLVLAGTSSTALINPNFRPVELVKQSEGIYLLRFTVLEDGKPAVAECRKTMKGAPLATPQQIDLSAAEKKEDAEEALAWARAASKQGDGPVLLFIGKNEKDEPISLLHFNGRWAHLERGAAANAWKLNHLNRQDEGMEGTWAGGTDMLLRLTETLIKHPEIDVPAAIHSSWEDPLRVAGLEGKVRSVRLVDLRGDGRMVLHVLCEGGDHFYSFNKERKPENLREAKGLCTASQCAAWGDFDGDGRVDIASWNGKALDRLLQKEDGNFAPAPQAVPLEPAPVGLVAVAGGGKTAALAWAAADGVHVLGDAGAKRLESEDLASLGQFGSLLAGDLDGDGHADLLLLSAKGSVCYRGAANGAFEKGKVLAPRLGQGNGAAALGDFDMDGRLDVLAVAEYGAGLWHNRGNMEFTNEVDRCGEFSYIAKPGGLVCGCCDVNNDGRHDLFVAYAVTAGCSPQIFFNRGCRSFGHAHSTDLDASGQLAESRNGVQAGLVGDVDGDGAQDMVLALDDGALHVLFQKTDAGGPLALRVVPPPGTRGPMVICADEEARSYGAVLVPPGSEAFFGVSEAGEYSVRWTGAGGKEHRLSATVEDKPVRVILPGDGR